jgi:RNA polymerase sigma-70 factor (ECF subfamily)
MKPPRAAATQATDTAALLRRLAQGEPEALAQIYRAEAGPVYRYALALSGNAAWAADATQDAFVALAARPDGFDPARGALGAYLAGIARHALAARWRQCGAEQSLDAAAIDAAADVDAVDGGSSADAPWGASPETALVRLQDGQALWQALRALPAPFREAVVLVDLQERPYAEAARIAGIELNTLRTRLHRARSRLAALLGAAAGSTA